VGRKADNQLKKKGQCLNASQCQEILKSCVYFPLKLGNSELDGQMSAFQEPWSTGKLSTFF